MAKVKETAKSRTIEDVYPEISNPPICNSILVTGIPEGTTKDSVDLQFENPKNGGGEIYHAEHFKKEGKAIISFYDPNGEYQ